MKRRERIEAAVETAGTSLTEPHQAWISAYPFRAGVQGLITGRHGFERTVRFAIDENPTVIRERLRETLGQSAESGCRSQVGQEGRPQINEGEDGGTQTTWRTLLCRWRLTSHNPVFGSL